MSTEPVKINIALIRALTEAVNRRDMAALTKYMSPKYYDHELDGDHRNDLQEGGRVFQDILRRVPDLQIEIRDIFAADDKVVARCVWQGREQATNEQMEYHGFVQWRIEDGLIAEHWQTNTPMSAVGSHLKQW